MDPQIVKYEEKRPILANLTVKSDFEGKSCKVHNISPT